MYDKHFKQISVLKYKLIFNYLSTMDTFFFKLTTKMRKINSLGDAIKQMYDIVSNNLIVSQVK